MFRCSNLSKMGSLSILLKDMLKNSLLFKDESLTPNIDKDMPVQSFRRRAQKTRKSAKNELFNFGISFYSTHEKGNPFKLFNGHFGSIPVP